MSLDITERAACRIHQALAGRQKGKGIRLAVRTTGCSGLAYALEFVDQEQKEDLVFQTKDIHVFVDPKSYQYIKGMRMDYEKHEFEEGFVFKNPNEKARCGCGESFTV